MTFLDDYRFPHWTDRMPGPVQAAAVVWAAIPAMWRAVRGRFHCLRDSPDWLVERLAEMHEFDRATGADEYELYRQAHEEYRLRLRRLGP